MRGGLAQLGGLHWPVETALEQGKGEIPQWFQSTWSHTLPQALIVNDPDLVRVLGQALPKTQLFTEDQAHALAQNDEGLAEWLTRQKHLADGLNFLHLPNVVRIC